MKRVSEFLSPIVYLSNNWISHLGVVLVTTAAVFWLFLLPAGQVSHPYLGILTYLLLPAGFFLGLGLIPLGLWLRRRRMRRDGTYPHDAPPLNLHSVELRRLLAFFGLATLANIVIAGSTTYQAVEYMDSVSFCGLTCHTVMSPEFTAYQNSPHSRVECVKCHTGPGASFFVKSKLDGVRRVVALALNTWERPIPAPVHELRPAREICGSCHWPQKYGENVLRVVTHFDDNEANTLKKTVLLMRIGAIHRAHQRAGLEITYAPAEEKRQKIAWVRVKDKQREKLFRSTEKTAELTPRIMDCIDCHNRPSHAFELPERAVDKAIAEQLISAGLPFARKKAIEILRASQSGAAAERAFVAAYQSQNAQKNTEIAQSARQIRYIFERNIFPARGVKWGTYPNNIGHNDFEGCFRCHNDNHVDSGGKAIGQDCNACHSLVAMDEPNPKILTELGVQ